MYRIVSYRIVSCYFGIYFTDTHKACEAGEDEAWLSRAAQATLPNGYSRSRGFGEGTVPSVRLHAPPMGSLNASPRSVAKLVAKLSNEETEGEERGEERREEGEACLCVG